MQPHPRHYGWFVKRLDSATASVRLRVLGPIAALRARGVAVEAYRETSADRYDAIIFSKSLTRRAVAIARNAKAAGKAVILDLCDNIFDQARPGSAKRRRLVAQLEAADLVSVSTETLGEQIAAHMPAIAGKLRVVPDMLEDFSVPRRPSPIARWALSRLRYFLDRHDGALRCVWFGNSSGASGVAHLDAAVRQLESFAQRHPVTLTVIADDRLAYLRAARRWAIPHHYLPWALSTFGDALGLHRVAVIPVALNEYTRGKTINRPATAIRAGLGVIASPIASYEELRPFIMLDDWQAGLDRYARHWNAEQPRLAAARRHLEAHYGTDGVTERWAALLEESGPN